MLSTSLAVRLAESRSQLVDRLVLISGGAPIPLKPEPGLLSLPSMCLALCTPCIRWGFLRYFPAAIPVVEHKDEILRFPVHPRLLCLQMRSQIIDANLHCLLPSPIKSLYSRPTKLEMKETFCLNAYTLRATMAGQIWQEGTKEFYEKLNLPVLLISGANDKLVPLSEEEEALHVSTMFSLGKYDNTKERVDFFLKI
ncbi:unnamed protein product [Schistocephalus solidus]|uniref:Hydrolase_4 domain-containing protein n=1 Tax=Schistocephalus solidus TaxID=70667 RepID=A0A183T666_SCHSO|nr:unnamed protein product [Schistocephalus solidus]